MFKIRHAADRGKTAIDWLDSRHSFSFAQYYDPAYMGFSDLRVINDDIVAPGMGFGTHPHDNMEIVSVVLSGALEHKDSMGSGEVLKAGEVQRMSAGSGVFHSEFNPSKTDPVHFLQIWILPEGKEIEPEYEQKAFKPSHLDNRLGIIVSRGGREGSLHINQDIDIYQSKLDGGQNVSYEMKPRRKIWIQVAEGEIKVNTYTLKAGDGLAIAEENGKLEISGVAPKSNFLLFDLRP